MTLEQHLTQAQQTEVDGIYGIWQGGDCYCTNCAYAVLFNEEAPAFVEAVLGALPTLKTPDGMTIELEHEDSFQYATELPYMPEGLDCSHCGNELYPRLEEEEDA